MVYELCKVEVRVYILEGLRIVFDYFDVVIFFICNF